MRPWKLAEVNYGHVKEQRYEVAVLPLGCTEPHNRHLPYGTDTLECDMIGDHVCEAAYRAGAKVMLLPTIPYGTVSNQHAFPFSGSHPDSVIVSRPGSACLTFSAKYSGSWKP